MKDTGLPSPFIDIMMLRPALRTSQTSLLQLRVGDLDHAARQAEVGHQLHQLLQLARLTRSSRRTRPAGSRPDRP